MGQPKVEHRHILEPDHCRWNRAKGESYCCLAVDSQFTPTTSQSAHNRREMYSGKAKANGVKVETGVIHKGPFQRFLSHVLGPVPASAHDFLLVHDVLLPSLHRNEKLSGDRLYWQLFDHHTLQEVSQPHRCREGFQPRRFQGTCDRQALQPRHQRFRGVLSPLSASPAGWGRQRHHARGRVEGVPVHGQQKLSGFSWANERLEHSKPATTR